MSIFDLFFPKVRLPRITQVTDSHCGPATLAMLLAHQHRYVTQDEIVTAGHFRSRIKAQGSRPHQLARAVTALDPDLQYWFKQGATTRDLDVLVNQYRWPVAVNWQGLFYDTQEEQDKKRKVDGEDGHYSVVIDFKPDRDQITLADPYPGFSQRPRVFSYTWFTKRWWDIAHDKDHKTGLVTSIKPRRFIFIIAPKNATFPQKLKMKLPEDLGILQVKPTQSVKRQASTRAKHK